jgi:predicted ATP-grasp superfamily ATP-dependent carboligase
MQIRKQHDQAPVVFPTRDFDVLFLHRYREQLGGLYRLPDDGAFRILDKMALAKTAIENGVSVPATVACSSVDEIERAADELQFPLVLKPRSAHQWRCKDAWEKVGSRKAILARSADELRREYSRIATVNAEVLVQEFISGEETDIVVCCCYIGGEGQLAACFTARKLRQNPPVFGTGCAVEIADIPEIVPIATRLLQGCGYTGLAEVEFKHDRATGKFYLIEVNPRHWDQHQLGNLVGVNLTWTAYNDMIGNIAVPQNPVYEGRKCRWIAEAETLMLIVRNAYVQSSTIRNKPKFRMRSRFLAYAAALRTALAESIFLLRGRKIFATFSGRDPLPGLNLCLRGVRDMYNVVRAHRVFQTDAE